MYRVARTIYMYIYSVVTVVARTIYIYSVVTVFLAGKITKYTVAYVCVYVLLCVYGSGQAYS